MAVVYLEISICLMQMPQVQRSKLLYSKYLERKYLQFRNLFKILAKENHISLLKNKERYKREKILLVVLAELISERFNIV